MQGERLARETGLTPPSASNGMVTALLILNLVSGIYRSISSERKSTGAAAFFLTLLVAISGVQIWFAWSYVRGLQSFTPGT